jgi:hypothetical protein
MRTRLTTAAVLVTFSTSVLTMPSASAGESLTHWTIRTGHFYDCSFQVQHGNWEGFSWSKVRFNDPDCGRIAVLNVASTGNGLMDAPGAWANSDNQWVQSDRLGQVVATKVYVETSLFESEQYRAGWVVFDGI